MTARRQVIYSRNSERKRGAQFIRLSARDNVGFGFDHGQASSSLLLPRISYSSQTWEPLHLATRAFADYTLLVFDSMRRTTDFQTQRSISSFKYTFARCYLLDNRMAARREPAGFPGPCTAFDLRTNQRKPAAVTSFLVLIMPNVVHDDIVSVFYGQNSPERLACSGLYSDSI